MWFSEDTTCKAQDNMVVFKCKSIRLCPVFIYQRVPGEDCNIVYHNEVGLNLQLFLNN